MKTVLNALILGVLAGFASCSEDDMNGFVGTWTYSENASTTLEITFTVTKDLKGTSGMVIHPYIPQNQFSNNTTQVFKVNGVACDSIQITSNKPTDLYYVKIKNATLTTLGMEVEDMRVKIPGESTERVRANVTFTKK